MSFRHSVRVASDADKCRNHCSHYIDCRECPRNQSGRDKDSERNLSRICGEVAEWMRIYKIWFRVLSASCPHLVRGPSGRAVLEATLKPSENILFFVVVTLQYLLNEWAHSWQFLGLQPSPSSPIQMQLLAWYPVAKDKNSTFMECHTSFVGGFVFKSCL